MKAAHVICHANILDTVLPTHTSQDLYTDRICTLHMDKKLYTLRQ